ncbi:MAG: DUF1315 family protein [Oleiphilaceae bacterium]|nr:DUF1315 family protein [Oleiphilaceae bacterium]
MKFEDLAQQLDPEIYERFKQALALGKWPDGRVLTPEQKEICMQSVMLYEAKHGVPETERLGYVDTERKQSSCGSDHGDESGDSDTIRILH